LQISLLFDFYSFGDKKSGNKTETTHAEHPRNTPLENTKKFKKSLIGAAGAFFYKKTFTFSYLFFVL